MWIPAPTPSSSSPVWQPACMATMSTCPTPSLTRGASRLGVCAGIGAWNYPLQIASWKSGPALACGNTMVFKPSELTPLTAMALAQIYTDAGVPAGAFNVVHGSGPTGQALSGHPGVAKVSLTGSVPTGRRVMASAAETLKHVTMELGGKSPLILFDDCDLDNAVSAALLANFYTQGEVCSNGTRVFVASTIKDAFLERLSGPGRQDDHRRPTGPEDRYRRADQRRPPRQGAGLHRGRQGRGRQDCCAAARCPDDPALKDGYFLNPAVFDGCRDDMTLAREEIFGPVMAVLTFEDEDEVIGRANDTPYGLAAGVFTRDLARGHRVVSRLEAGTCWINNYNITPVEIPFGGYKQSGIGRENGLAALEHYTQLKTVYVELGDVDSPY